MHNINLKTNIFNAMNKNPYLFCYGNQLTELDVTGNSALRRLSCYGNQLTELDVTGNKALSYLDCHNNQLSGLDLTGNPVLTELYCTNNQLTELDISNNQNLSSFGCTGNPGENGVLMVKVWPGFGEVPAGFESGSYNYNGSTVTIKYWK